MSPCQRRSWDNLLQASASCGTKRSQELYICLWLVLGKAWNKGKWKKKKYALNSYCSKQNLRQNCRKASVPASWWGSPSALSSWPVGSCCCSDLVSPPPREPSKLLLAISALQLRCCAHTGQAATPWCAAGQEAESWTQQLTLKTLPSTLL